MRELTAERLREILDYDPATGGFVRAVDLMCGHRLAQVSPRARKGQVVGTPLSNGYLSVRIEGKTRLLHRLAWLHVTGSWPSGDIDHINGDRTDNRFSNLRDVNRSVNLQNMRNARRSNPTGLLGITWSKRRQKWIAQIKTRYKGRYLGSFDTPEEAHKAYLVAKRRLHEGCTI